MAAQQDTHAWEDYLMDVIDIEDYDEAQLAEVYETLSEREMSPMNINTATFEDFTDIPGMTIDIISDIMFYRDKYGAMRSMEELALIPSVSRQLRLLLSHLFVAGAPERSSTWYKRPALDSLLHHGSATLLLSGNIPFYTRKGYEGNYLGDKYKYDFKLNGKFGEYIKYGLVGAKGEGEPFFAHGNNSGFDNYGGFVSLYKLGFVKQLTVGQYRLRLGQGLIVNNGFSLGKQYMLSGMNEGAANITGHASRSDGHHLQGAAITFNVPFQLSLFWSYRNIDATLNKDGTVATLLTSGYHRTETEMGKKNNTSELVTGGRIGWKHKGWHIGLSGVYTWYDRDLNPSEKQLYRRYYPCGNAFVNVSTDYGYLSRRLTIQGETAMDGKGNIATLNMATALLPRDIRLTAVQRYYAYQYSAVLASSFSEGGQVRNESGIYLGVQLPLMRRLRLDLYSDYAYFPWARFYTELNEGLPTASTTWDNAATLTYDYRKWSFAMRYRLKSCERHNTEKTALLPRTEQSARLSATRTTGIWTHRTQMDLRLASMDGKTSRGYIASQMIAVKAGKVWSGSVSGAYFNATSNDTRLYLYERGMLESFSSASFSGEGFRLSGVVRADISRRLMLLAKIGFTNYLDRATISTGDREIPRAYQTDLDVQVRLRI